MREEGFDLLEVGVLIADAGVGADEGGFGRCRKGVGGWRGWSGASIVVLVHLLKVERGLDAALQEQLSGANKLQTQCH